MRDLRIPGFFLEIGMDEDLLNFPWELMHDGHDYYCLKHSFGRFVNSKQPSPDTSQFVPSEVDTTFHNLSVLVISVPNPLPRESGLVYDRLPAVEEETNAIIETLCRVGIEPELLQKENATFDEVWNTVRENRYHIIHFSGHAHFDDDAQRSGLVLHNRNMSTGQIRQCFNRRPPILFFINGCETTNTSDWSDRHNIYGLARSFLNTKAYLLGSRWKIEDRAAAEFAKKFYTMLTDEVSLGEAVKEGRIACKNTQEADNVFAWASYILYGDPRVYFKKE
jgi:CHAT domain-containing protein